MRITRSSRSQLLVTNYEIQVDSVGECDTRGVHPRIWDDRGVKRESKEEVKEEVDKEYMEEVEKEVKQEEVQKEINQEYIEEVKG